jgi:hypothetical protein
MDVAGFVAQQGGCVTWSQLRQVTSERALASAVREGRLVRVARGRSVLPTETEHRQTAARHSAVLSHLSAAVTHGWAVKWQPEQSAGRVPAACVG